MLAFDGTADGGADAGLPPLEATGVGVPDTVPWHAVRTRTPVIDRIVRSPFRLTRVPPCLPPRAVRDRLPPARDDARARRPRDREPMRKVTVAGPRSLVRWTPGRGPSSRAAGGRQGTL